MPKQLSVVILIFLFSISACTVNSEKSTKDQQAIEKTESEPKKETSNSGKEKKPPQPSPAVKKKAPKPKPQNVPVPAIAKNDVKALSDRDFVSTMLNLVNTQRKNGCVCGSRKYGSTRALKWSTTLQKIAHDHSIDMARNSKMSHNGSNGSDVNDRLDAGGYAWRGYGENVAFGQRSIQQVFESWIKSPSHCKNIMNPELSEIGVAQQSYYWTMVMAAPKRPLM